ncbi:11305_t:CDS:2, partial [Racocetra persica]
MNNDNEPYSGYHDNAQCSYTEFLHLNRNVVLLSQPFSDKWNVLDLTWARRFLSQAKELKEHDYATTLKEEKLYTHFYLQIPVDKKQRANKSLQIYWEEIIYEREKMKAQRAHLTGSMKVYSKVAEHNAKTLSSEDYSNIYPFQSGYPKIIIDKENNPFLNMFEKNEKDKVESEYSEESDANNISEDENFSCNDDYKENNYPKIDKKFFHKTHKSIPNSSKMKLSTGTIVEDVLFDFCKNMDYEHHHHSYIIDYDDKEVKALFTEIEWQELTVDRLGVPPIPTDIAKKLSTYKKKTLKELREVSMTSYLRDNVKYNIHQHYDDEWIQLSIRNLVNLYENTDCPLMRNHYEDWYTVALFGSCIDFCFRDMWLGTDIKRTDALASANRKNLIEAARSFKGVSDRKYLIENFKMPKSLRDMLAEMIRDVNYEEER